VGRYDDIINLPRHVSSTRPQMPMIDRAAQFMPFRALTGYEDAVHETARLTEERVELTEEEKYYRRTERMRAAIDDKFMNLDEAFVDDFVDGYYQEMYEDNGNHSR